MFNRELKTEALKRLEQEKKNFDSQLSMTTHRIEAFYEKKLEALNSINDFDLDIDSLKDKPLNIEEKLYRINFVLKNSNYKKERLDLDSFNCENISFDDIGGFAGIFTGIISSKLNKEISECETRKIEYLKNEIQELKKITSNIDFSFKELDCQLSTFLDIVKYKINLKGKSHWSELSDEEINYIGSAVNLAFAIANMLMKKGI